MDESGYCHVEQSKLDPGAGTIAQRTKVPAYASKRTSGWGEPDRIPAPRRLKAGV